MKSCRVLHIRFSGIHIIKLCSAITVDMYMCHNLHLQVGSIAVDVVKRILVLMRIRKRISV